MKLKENKGYIMIFAAGMLWGTIGLFVNILNGMGIPSVTIAFLRLATGAIVMIPFMLAIGGKSTFKIDRKGLLVCLALGVFCQAMFNYSYNESIETVGVATGAILLYTSPIFVCIMSKLFLKENIGTKKLIALVINVIGCVLTITNADFSQIHFSVYGVAAGIMAGFLYGSMTIISKPATGKYNPITIIFYSFIFGSIFLAFLGNPIEDIAGAISIKFIIAALVYGLVTTAGAYFFYMNGLSRIKEPSKAPVVASVETVVAAIIGVAVFSEAFGLYKLIGIGLVVTSIVIMNSKSSLPKPRQ